MTKRRHLARRGWTRGVALLSATVIMFGATGCERLARDHGYVPSEADLVALTVGVDTRETVAEAVGTPSSSGVLRDSGYFYVSQRVERYAYFAPEVVEREVVAISFDGRGVVRNIERFGLEDGQPVALSRRVTESSVEGLTFIQQLLGTVRNFDVGSFIANRDN